MQQKAIKKVLLIGRGDTTKEALNCDEIQSCIAAIEQEVEVILLSDSNPDSIIDTALNVPVYQLPFSEQLIKELTKLEKPDAVFAPFVDSLGWKLTHQLAQKGLWADVGIQLWNHQPLKSRSLKNLREIRRAISKASLRQCQRVEVSSYGEALPIPDSLGGFPVVVRTERGVDIVRDQEAFKRKILLGLNDMPKVIIEECLAGWKEVSVGVIQDTQGATSVIHTSENIMPVGIHAHDSMTVSPFQTLYDHQREYLFGAALRIAKTMEWFVGYCQITFAINPCTEQILVLGVNFDTNRSVDVSLSVGYPLLKIITNLAMGCTIEDLNLKNLEEQEQKVVILKVPQFDQKSVISGSGILGPRAKSTGEKIYVGRNFCEAFRKASYQETVQTNPKNNNFHTLDDRLFRPYWNQLYHVYQTFLSGSTVEEVQRLTDIDPWFLQQVKLISEVEQQLHQDSIETISKEGWATLKLFGFTDQHIASVLSIGYQQVSEHQVQKQRELYGVYSSLSSVGRAQSDILKADKKIMVLTESSCSEQEAMQVPAFLVAKEAKQMGFELVMVNSNPNAIPFWLGFADQLYIEPMDWETVYEIYREKRPRGIFVETSSSIPVELEERFTKIGASVVKVPFELAKNSFNQKGA